MGFSKSNARDAKLPVMQQTFPRLSVIIPTLNEEARIGALLTALELQTLEALEVIVVDGHSEDRTVEVAESYSGSLSSLSVFSTQRGTARQRNFGGHVAAGELLIFMDADTLPERHFFQRISRSYTWWPFAVACPWFVAQEKSLAVRFIYFVFNILFWLGQSWLRTGSGVCIITPKKVFERTGGFDESLHLGEDIHFIRRAARYGWHRHLLVPLRTSGRRFEQKGAWRLAAFYIRISPLIMLGRWESLKRISYEAAPYKK